MPMLECPSRVLFEKLGRKFNPTEFNDLCFDFGLELDEVTSEREKYRREHGSAAKQEVLDQISDEEKYKVELPANRYDLLSTEGLALSLLVFMKKRKPPALRLTKPVHTMVVKPSILPYRPYVVCAVLRNIKFNADSYDSFIALQEKLHGTIAKKRSLVSLGTHDLDTIEGPFTYEATPKEDIDFLPLAHKDRGNLRGKDIEEYYKNDTQIGTYVPLISSFPAFPVIYDSKRTVMSLPPIINSEHSKISMDTKNIFVECTAVDYNKAMIALNVLVTSFSEYCEEPFTVEPVTVKYPKALPWVEKEEDVTPNFTPRTFTVDTEYMSRAIGVTIPPEEIVGLLERMMLRATPTKDGSQMVVEVPPTRADILHPADIMEDVAIAYGYDNILERAEMPKTLSIGSQQPREKLKQLLRVELASAGFTEMLTFSLCSRDEAFSYCQRPDNGTAVTIANPKTQEFQICRPSLLPGTMKTVQFSKDKALPLKLFEISDVVLKDATHPIGARNEAHVCAIYAAKDTAGFEFIHGFFETCMEKLDVKRRSDDHPDGWYMEQGNDDDAFWAGRQVDCFYKKQRIGSFGILSVPVIKAYKLTFPCSYMEFNLEPFIASH